MMRGMPPTTITLGERFTAFAEVIEHSARTTQQIAGALDTSPLRAGNIMRELEDADLVTSMPSLGTLAEQGELLWQNPRSTARFEEQVQFFDTEFPGLTTHRVSRKDGRTQQARDTRAPRPQQGGDMSTTTPQFTKATDKASSKKADIVAKMLDILRKSDEPVPFIKGLCDPAGAKYPQDVEASMMALETLGLVERYTFVEGDSTRSRVAYKWAGEEARPTSSTSTASKKRSSQSAKKTPAKAAAQKEDKAQEAPAAS